MRHEPIYDHEKAPNYGTPVYTRDPNWNNPGPTQTRDHQEIVAWGVDADGNGYVDVLYYGRRRWTTRGMAPAPKPTTPKPTTPKPTAAELDLCDDLQHTRDGAFPLLRGIRRTAENAQRKGLVAIVGTAVVLTPEGRELVSRPDTQARIIQNS